MKHKYRIKIVDETAQEYGEVLYYPQIKLWWLPFMYKGFVHDNGADVRYGTREEDLEVIESYKESCKPVRKVKPVISYEEIL